MPDLKYCYENTDVLRNKLNIKDTKQLFAAEVKLTSVRLQELEVEPISGDFDFRHLKEIHRYIFQDLYDWAGEIRTVEIGKGNLFCTTPYIDTYAESVFSSYYKHCYAAKGDIRKFVAALARNYGDLNALHPFREGNGRAQREFARILCLECGYDFRLSCTTHKEMLDASKLSFDRGDNSGLVNIFERAVTPIGTQERNEESILSILTSDDLSVTIEESGYDYYDSSNSAQYALYNALFETKIKKMRSDNNQA